MGGCRCSYKNCQNSTKSSENLHFFHYPVRHKERCKLWIEMANKPQFCDLEEDQLRNKVICEQHFEDKYFPNPLKKRLLQGAVPSLDGDSLEPPVEIPLTEDVHIMPANDDGTIFMVKTENTFKRRRAQECESYVYKNGLILPSRGKRAEIKKEIKMENDGALHRVLDNKEMQVVTGMTINATKRTTNPVSITSMKPKKVLNRLLEPIVHPNFRNPQIMRDELSIEDDKPNIEHVEIQDLQEDISIVPATPKQNLNGSTSAKKPEAVPVNKNYLRKIKQHSREIATIKKMLQEKTKLDMGKILEALKESVPPTLYTIVELNMKLQCDLTMNDLQFFGDIHKHSPQVYDLLINKYDWKLPDMEKYNSENSM
ncbi:unnamed protein product [Brassicogethes aeneus]|uniref:THAP-type domain-containing protein n=1 Tax=Brassicogethes aeneus TaxID=1431903 RepID=A0A9P0BFU2_BRAAE|nr:unnamed protein product [Brassicogethes aeneus]